MEPAAVKRCNFQINPFPTHGTQSDQIAWFQNETNLNFSDIGSKTVVNTYNSLCDLIVQVTGLSSADTIHTIFEAHLDLSGRAVKGQKGWVIQKSELVNKVLADIAMITKKREYANKASDIYRCYRTWLCAALIAYAPREVTIARRKVIRQSKTDSTRSSEPLQPDMDDPGLKMVDESTKYIPFELNMSSKYPEEPQFVKFQPPKKEKVLNQEMAMDKRSQSERDQSSTQKFAGLSEHPLLSHESEPKCSSPNEPIEPANGLPDMAPANWIPEPPTINIETRRITLRNGLYRPLGLGSLARVSVSPNEFSFAGPNANFDATYLGQALGADQISPGCYSIRRDSFILQLFPNITSYRVVAAIYDPLVPQAPGNHGAQISFLVPPVKYDGSMFPVFLQAASGEGYRYLGMYRHPSAPDYLGRSEMAMLPLGLMMRWCNWILIDEKTREMAENLIGKKM